MAQEVSMVGQPLVFTKITKIFNMIVCIIFCKSFEFTYHFHIKIIKYGRFVLLKKHSSFVLLIVICFVFIIIVSFYLIIQKDLKEQQKAAFEIQDEVILYIY